MGNNKSVFCLSCFDDRNPSCVSIQASIPNHPKSEYEVPISQFPKLNHSINEEAHISRDDMTSVFLSFKTEDRPKTNSFFSFPPSKSFEKSFRKEEDKQRVSNFLKSPNFRSSLLENVFKLISSDYEDFECIYNDIKSDIKLKIYLKSYMRSKSRVNVFRTEYIAPCLPLEYLDFANDVNLQKELDLAANEYYVVRKLNDKTSLLYLSYKKTIITSPRDFLYLKTHGEITHEAKTYYCIVGKSIDMDDFLPNNETIRCEIINSGYAIEENQGKSIIRTYSEFDFKINIPLFIIRNFSVSESRRFVENSIKKLKEILGKTNSSF